ncbi:amyloid-beta A4 precursor protein-binding family A member 2-like [Aotus nancymaae]|uniref:amyloid-beta A4 precursor protein-binding family A member 2-like n=1 Tax=Aotus nancymaae TaxID=37293 RepID=UPI0030FE3C9E
MRPALSMGLSQGLGTLQRPALPARPQQARGEGQVTVNLPSKAKHHGDPQRGFKPNTRTPEERPKCPHEQLRGLLLERAAAPRDCSALQQLRTLARLLVHPRS